MSDQVQNEQAPEPIKFDEWIQAQDEPIKQAFEAHTTGLKNTVHATRQERDALAKEIKELSKKAEVDSDMQKSLNELSSKLEITEKRATFAEEAVKPEIGCTNPKAAWLVAVAQDAFDRKGNPDWNAIKNEAPELFGKPAAKGNAGAGTGSTQTASTMNDFIRRSRGR